MLETLDSKGEPNAFGVGLPFPPLRSDTTFFRRLLSLLGRLPGSSCWVHRSIAMLLLERQE